MAQLSSVNRGFFCWFDICMLSGIQWADCTVIIFLCHRNDIKTHNNRRADNFWYWLWYTCDAFQAVYAYSYSSVFCCVMHEYIHAADRLCMATTGARAETLCMVTKDLLIICKKSGELNIRLNEHDNVNSLTNYNRKESYGSQVEDDGW